MTKKIELLAPAKNADIGRAAILSGADAVYIGAEKFSARAAAGNRLSEIESLIDFAKQFYARVYIAMNTLLSDDEIQTAKTMIDSFYALGADGLIIQDMGLLEMDIPPIPLIASTQTDNTTPEKVKFLQDVGFSRVILARELSLDQIKEIRSQTDIELECFVHGALCVAASGQCYLSYAMGRRSGNRGDCAQPCRQKYGLRDLNGQTISANKHLLSIKDMNRSEFLGDLLDAGVTTFKIEGRLKDQSYVTNIVSHYNRLLNNALESRDARRVSSGVSTPVIDPDPAKTFNRGFTSYNIRGKSGRFGAIHSPKSVGEPLGKIKTIQDKYFTLDRPAPIHNGDGFCFFSDEGELSGTRANRVQGNKIFPDKIGRLSAGMEIYRNFDHEFVKTLASRSPQRIITVNLTVTETDEAVVFECRDSDTISARLNHPKPDDIAKNPTLASETIQKQLKKTGDSIFKVEVVDIQLNTLYFFPVSVLNQIRRELFGMLLENRKRGAPKPQTRFHSVTSIPFPVKSLDFHANVLNAKARDFYVRHGVEITRPAAETGLDLTSEIVAKTKYCVRKELNLCPASDSAEPLILFNPEGYEFELTFDCETCGMTVRLDKKGE